MPTLVLDRVFTDAFESKWLNWLGPCDFDIFADLLLDRDNRGGDAGELRIR